MNQLTLSAPAGLIFFAKNLHQMHPQQENLRIHWWKLGTETNNASVSNYVFNPEFLERGIAVVQPSCRTLLNGLPIAEDQLEGRCLFCDAVRMHACYC